MELDDFDPDVDAVLFDFSGVVANVRMATSGDSGALPYVIEPFDEVVDGITRLRDAEFRTGLITNNDRRAFEEEVPLNLDEWFDVVVFSSDVGVNKPHVRIFEHALELLNLDARRCVFLDDIARNADAAESLGMQAIVADNTETTLAVIDAVIEHRHVYE